MEKRKLRGTAVSSPICPWRVSGAPLGQLPAGGPPVPCLCGIQSLVQIVTPAISSPALFLPHPSHFLSAVLSSQHEFDTIFTPRVFKRRNFTASNCLHPNFPWHPGKDRPGCCFGVAQLSERCVLGVCGGWGEPASVSGAKWEGKSGHGDLKQHQRNQTITLTLALPEASQRQQRQPHAAVLSQLRDRSMPPGLSQWTWFVSATERLGHGHISVPPPPRAKDLGSHSGNCWQVALADTSGVDLGGGT